MAEARRIDGRDFLPFKKAGPYYPIVRILPVGLCFPSMEKWVAKGWEEATWEEYAEWIKIHRPNPQLDDRDPVALARSGQIVLPEPPPTVKMVESPWTNQRWLMPEDLQKFQLKGHPAFILGNSPFLPVEALSALNRFFTIGVNRILQIYDPTILLYCDLSVWKDIADVYPKRGCQIITSGDFVPKNVVDAAISGSPLPGKPIWQIQMGRDETGRSLDMQIPRHPGYVVIDGNTGVAAASWALALGCNPVYILGLDAAYSEKFTNTPQIRYSYWRAAGHQWGVNPYHDRQRNAGELPRGDTMAVMREKLNWLLANHGDVVLPLADAVAVESACNRWSHLQRERQWYVNELLGCLET